MRSVPGTAGGVVEAVVGNSRWLWTVALLFFGVGDVATTLAGIGVGAVVEGGPLVAWLLARHSVAALVVLKLGAFGVGYALWASVPRPHNVGAPLALAVLGVAVTAWNAAVLAAAMH